MRRRLWPSEYRACSSAAACGGLREAAVRASFDPLKSPRYDGAVKRETVRTSIDLPRDLHRRLHEKAARDGSSARRLILACIERAVDEPGPVRRKRRLSLDIPIVS